MSRNFFALFFDLVLAKDKSTMDSTELLDFCESIVAFSKRFPNFTMRSE